MVPLLSVENLAVSFASERGRVRILEDVSFELGEGETLALVGESGSGKSVTAQSILRILPDTARVESGDIRLSGESLLARSEKEMEGVRGRRIAMIFQEPMTSLSPVHTIGNRRPPILPQNPNT